jgi:two-component system nitrate/nitrite response regulator NarL
MKLFFVGNREKVLERWRHCLQSEWQVDQIESGLLAEWGSPRGVLLVHLSSISAEQKQAVFSYKQRCPDGILICCTDLPNETEGMEVLQAGANGYTNTYVTASLLTEVMKTVLRGDIWAGPELLQKLLKRLLQTMPVTDNKVDTAEYINCFDGLSSREREVLAVLVTGASNKEIARELDITERTVKAHLSSIFQKTGATDRISLVLMSRQVPAH